MTAAFATLVDDAPTRPRVLIVGNFVSGARAYRSFCEDLADRLEGEGYRVTRTSRVDSRIGRALDIARTIWRCRHSLDVAQVDVFSGRAFALAEMSCWLLRRVGIPYVLTLHGGGLPDFCRRHRRRTRALFSRAHTITAPSRFLEAELHEFRSDIRHVPNAVDLGRLRYTAPAPERGRILWLRAFHSLYNPALAPHVLAELRRFHPYATMTMVGPDRGDGSLDGVRAEIERLGLGAAMTLIPGVSPADIPTVLSNFDVFLNTTNVDNTPVSVLEAMAAGLCIVSTNVGGLPHLLESERTALLVPPRDKTAAASALRRVIEDPDMARRLSLGARAVAEAHDWGPVLRQWQQVLHDAAGTGR